MFDEDDLVPLSALQHYVVCPRQCALIHVEQAWAENALTAEGRILHERVDRGGAESRPGVRRAYGLPLRSLKLGVSGRADLVEFHRAPGGGAARPFPVEHKRGRPKDGDEDRVQLCAQALCLEEMLGADVPEGALFYGAKARRLPVAFDAALRRRTEAVAASVHALLAEGATPLPPPQAPCAACSLVGLCLPRACRRGPGAVAAYLARALSSS